MYGYTPIFHCIAVLFSLYHSIFTRGLISFKKYQGIKLNIFISPFNNGENYFFHPSVRHFFASFLKDDIVRDRFPFFRNAFPFFRDAFPFFRDAFPFFRDRCNFFRHRCKSFRHRCNILRHRCNFFRHRCNLFRHRFLF